MKDRIDPRVFAKNFEMVPELPEPAPLAPPDDPMLAQEPDNAPFQSQQPAEPSPISPPSYGPAVREPQKTLEIRAPRPEPGAYPPFYKRMLIDAGEAYRVVLQPGWVIDRSTVGGESPPECVIPLMPVYIDGETSTRLDATPRPEIPIAIGNFLYCIYDTSDHGDIFPAETEDDDLPPRVEVSSDDKGGVHYQPRNPGEEEGTKGRYWVKLGQLTAGESEGDPPVWIPYQQSDIEHYHEIRTNKNVGSGKEVFRKHNPEDAEDEYRTLSARDSDPQIRVRYDNEEAEGPVTEAERIIVEGTGHDSTCLWENCDGDALGKIEIIDGLAKAYTWSGSEWTEGGFTIVVPDCPETPSE
jgi:hypothetical protein